MYPRRVTVRLLAAAILAISSIESRAHDLTGRAHIVDGDTIIISETHIRLQGIDSPETDQVCLDAKGERWKCGVTARDRLLEHIGQRAVSCTDLGRDRYKRILGVCYAGSEDLNAWMVREGFALAYVKYSREYVAEEKVAQIAKRGMWAGAFIAPWDWRQRNKQTIILGDLSVPITAQAKLLTPASAAKAPSPKCIIKGNVNWRGERIYHMPGQSAYGKINMNESEKRWFCSEEEARAAGWRPAVR